MKQYLLTFLLALFTVFTLAACGGADEVQEPAETQTETEGTEETTGESFPITITDGVENEVTIEAKPEKIVSLIPSNTEIVYALDMGDALVGVSDFDNYPEEVATKEKIGGMEFNVEKVISLQPDLVLAHGSSAFSSESGLEQLRNAGITVVVVPDATSFEATYESIHLIGKLTGTSVKAEEIVEDMKTRLAEIKEKASEVTEPATVWVEVSGPPEIYTTGKGTFMHEMIEAINAKNAAGEQEGWVMLTEEEIVALNPDVVVTTYGSFDPNAKANVLAREAWTEVPAIQNERVYDIQSDLVSRPGPRLIEGVEELAKAVYPEVFTE
ncbi:ABC transporter substrate-binding protein [Bacillus mesophilus]|uniref:ABC transporter substrate-binding protein n=1 Tax=Bacillus mesophilus TaxID=1808955 RepID=A0A6M0Q4P4_9BACI|nr:ABC transporter substrate-binding protein [Bacillus mesophilus]NEY71291.1 ABC transporter substrate-binding protein [Bacillus mesophilus]